MVGWKSWQGVMNGVEKMVIGFAFATFIGKLFFDRSNRFLHFIELKNGPSPTSLASKSNQHHKSIYFNDQLPIFNNHEPLKILNHQHQINYQRDSTMKLN